MYYVYVLFSKKDNKLYIGYSPDLKLRIRKHNSGLVRATKFRQPLRLIYYESYLEISDAKRREKYLKSGGGRRELAKQLEDIYHKLGYNYSNKWNT